MEKFTQDSKDEETQGRVYQVIKESFVGEIADSSDIFVKFNNLSLFL